MNSQIGQRITLRIGCPTSDPILVSVSLYCSAEDRVQARHGAQQVKCSVTEYHPAWHHLQPKAHHDAMLSALCPVLGTKRLADTSDSQVSPNGNMLGKGSAVVTERENCMYSYELTVSERKFIISYQ